MRLATSIIAGLVFCSANSGRGEEPEFRFSGLSPAVRRTADQRAMQIPGRNGRLAVQNEFSRDVADWIVARTPLPAEEEVRRAAAAHQQLETETVCSPPPRAAEEVFSRLVEQLPPHMRPKGFQYSLTVINSPGTEAFTLGAGRIYIPNNYLAALLEDEVSGRDRLAFVLAHELGHVCRQHTRHGYQMLWIKELTQNHADREVSRRSLRKMLDRFSDVTVKGLRFLFSEEQDHKADLFALHLCRNAGFQLEACLDPLRERLVAVDPLVLKLADTAPDPDADPAVAIDAATLGHAAKRIGRRLKRLRAELDGTVANGGYGLFKIDPRTGKAQELKPTEIAAGQRVLVFVHGLESDITVFGPMAQHLSRQLQLPTLALRHPNDGSLARSGKLLKREIDRVIKSPEEIVFVCHSAGGLVFRWYAEVERGEFAKALLLGTPNAGSDLAKLRHFLEAKQFLGDFPLGYNAAVERAIMDSKGQIGFDLQPGSLFLEYLNREHPQGDEIRGRYTVIRGRALKARSALLATGSVAAGRRTLQHVTRRIDGNPMLLRAAENLVSRLRIPHEVTEGDLAVTLESATIDGSAQEHTLKVNHLQMLSDDRVLELIEQWAIHPAE